LQRNLHLLYGVTLAPVHRACFRAKEQLERMVTRLVSMVAIVTTVASFPSAEQERFSLFQPSTPESVERMLLMAGLRDDDVVVDLGSGNGLIPLTAARMNPRLRGWGVDINPTLVEQSNQLARAEGLSDRIRFFHRNAFDADLRDATVVTMWLFPELMQLLRPIILERARPGTRVLTSTWNLGTWQPDESSTDGAAVYMWIVPARVAGGWQWHLNVAGRRVKYSSLTEQHFQSVEGVVRAGDRREVIQDMKLRGDHLTFSLSITLDGLGLTRHEFSGRVEGDTIVGDVKLTPGDQSALTLPWRAQRESRSGYFEPTGTAMFVAPAKAR
jgi:precorrin-6B methylase 2